MRSMCYDAGMSEQIAEPNLSATTVYFAPVNRLVFYAADRLRGTEVRLREVFGPLGMRIDESAVPEYLERIGTVDGDIGPEGWMALRDGVLSATDHAGRVEAVRTAKERASAYGPVVRR